MNRWITLIVLCFSTQAFSADIPQGLFLQFMKDNGPDTLCSNVPLLQCLDVTAEQCREALVTPNVQCATRLKDTFPQQFADSEENARHYGSLYGICLLEGWKEAEPILATPMDVCFGV